jgi:cation-transporting ATPase 13A1
MGAKQGDYQLTVMGIVVAALFFFVTKGEPVNKLSPRRPPPSVLCLQVLMSIASQFSIHFACIMLTTALSKFYLDPFDPSLVPDGAFNPNTLNSATFVMTVLTTVNTFLVNYRGRPYMQDLVENKMMWKAIQFCYITLFVCVLELFPPLNYFMQLAPFPSSGESFGALTELRSTFSSSLISVVHLVGFKWSLLGLMVVDTALAYFVEKCIMRYFEQHS